MANNAIVYWDNENERQHRERESSKAIFDKENQREHERLMTQAEYYKERAKIENNENQRQHERWMTQAEYHKEQEKFENQQTLANLEFAKIRCQKLGTEEACSPLH